MPLPADSSNQALARLARPDELSLLPGIEASAATLFAGTAMASSIDGPKTSLDALESGLRGNSLWVAGDPAPAGFLLAAVQGEWLHILELSVARQAQRQGLGTALLQGAIAAAPALGCSTLSLTTDRWLAWNGPFYARHGFAEVPADDPNLPDWLAAMPLREAASGLDPARRCIMMQHA